MKQQDVAALMPILQAFADGKQIQYKSYDGAWTDADMSKDMSFSLQNDRYRIKPEPRVQYIVFNHGLAYGVRDHEEHAKNVARTLSNGTYAKFVEELP